METHGGVNMTAATLMAKCLSLFLPEDSRQGEGATPCRMRPPIDSGHQGVSFKAIFWAVMGIVFSILLSFLN